jgi:hypothetical protein
MRHKCFFRAACMRNCVACTQQAAGASGHICRGRPGHICRSKARTHFPLVGLVQTVVLSIGRGGGQRPHRGFERAQDGGRGGVRLPCGRALRDTGGPTDLGERVSRLKTRTEMAVEGLREPKTSGKPGFRCAAARTRGSGTWRDTGPPAKPLARQIATRGPSPGRQLPKGPRPRRPRRWACGQQGAGPGAGLGVGGEIERGLR